MLERKRQRKTYNPVPGEDDGDVELGEGHENGVTAGSSRSRTLEEEVDNWDENAPDDWEEDEAAPVDSISKAADPVAATEDSKKRTD